MVVTKLNRYNVSKLENEEKNTMFKVKLKEYLKLANSDKLWSINRKWKIMKEEIHTSSVTVKGKPMKTKKSWFNEVCKIAKIKGSTTQNI